MHPVAGRPPDRDKGDIMEPKYKRILLKLSGEALSGRDGNILDHEMLRKVSDMIRHTAELGVQVAVVIGNRRLLCRRTDGVRPPVARP